MIPRALWNFEEDFNAHNSVTVYESKAQISLLSEISRLAIFTLKIYYLENVLFLYKNLHCNVDLKSLCSSNTSNTAIFTRYKNRSPNSTMILWFTRFALWYRFKNSYTTQIFCNFAKSRTFRTTTWKEFVIITKTTRYKIISAYIQLSLICYRSRTVANAKFLYFSDIGSPCCTRSTKLLINCCNF